MGSPSFHPHPHLWSGSFSALHTFQLLLLAQLFCCCCCSSAAWPYMIHIEIYIAQASAAVAGGTIAMRYLHTVWCSLAKEAKNKSVFWWMHSFIADRVISQWMKLLCCGLGGSGCRTGIGQWRVFVGVESRVFIARPFIQVESFAASFIYSYRGKEENNTTTGNHYCNFKRQVGEVEVSQWRWGGRTFRRKEEEQSAMPSGFIEMMGQGKNSQTSGHLFDIKTTMPVGLGWVGAEDNKMVSSFKRIFHGSTRPSRSKKNLSSRGTMSPGLYARGSSLLLALGPVVHPRF